MEKICGIYCIENIVNTKKYVGQSRDIINRFRQHKNKLRNGKHRNEHLQNAWDKYKEDNFKFYIIEECSLDKLDEKEIYYIKSWNLQDRNYGYNIDSGGNANKVLSVETRNKISEIKKAENLSIETRKKMSESAKKRCDTLEWKRAHSYSILGKKLSEETKRKMSESRTGLKRNDEFKEKQRKAQIGFKVMCVETGEVFLCAKDAGIAMGLGNTSGGAILECCRGKRKTRGGYHWKFADEIQKSDASNESIQ